MGSKRAGPLGGVVDPHMWGSTPRRQRRHGDRARLSSVQDAKSRVATRGDTWRQVATGPTPKQEASALVAALTRPQEVAR
jgi:hypothetical protein